MLDGTADPNASGAAPLHPQAIGIDEQPLSDMASSRTGLVDHRASSAISTNERERTATPGTQSVDLERQRVTSGSARSD